MTWTSLALWSFFSLPATAPILPVVVSATADAKTCDLSGRLSLVDEKGERRPLQFAQVYLSDPVRPFNELSRPRETPIEINQPKVLQQFTFDPKFLVVQQGEVVRVLNPSSIERHEVHCYNERNVFEVKSSLKAVTAEQVFDELGVSILRCHKHHNMNGFVLTVPNRFRVTPEADGTFKLPGLPRGEVEITLWQGSDKPRLQFSWRRVRVDPCKPLDETLLVGTELPPTCSYPCVEPR